MRWGVGQPARLSRLVSSYLRRVPASRSGVDLMESESDRSMGVRFRGFRESQADSSHTEFTPVADETASQIIST